MLKIHIVNHLGIDVIKVLDKTFGILEEIAKATPRPVGPLELAKRLGLNRATCSRILRMLLDSGYILKVSRQAGYVAGPRILTLGSMAGFQSELLRKAVPVVDRTAAATLGAALISQVYAGERYVLYLKNRIPDRVIKLAELSFDDVFNTATGVVEAAYMDEAERMALYGSVAERGGEMLPEFRDRGMLAGVFSGIRDDKMYHCLKGELGIFAAPVFAGGRFVAALGCSITRERYAGECISATAQCLSAAAAELSAALSSIGSVG